MAREIKVNWDAFSQGDSFQVSEQEKKEPEEREATTRFIREHQETVASTFYDDDPMAIMLQQLHQDVEIELQETQHLLTELAEDLNENRSDAHLFKDPAKQSELLERQKRLAELRESMEKQEKRKQARQKPVNQSRSKPQSNYEQELMKRLEMASQQVQHVVQQVLPAFNPRFRS